jgi:hypothetical protein
MSAQLHTDPLSSLASDCGKSERCASWVQRLPACATTYTNNSITERAADSGESSSMEPRSGAFSAYYPGPVNEQQQLLAGEGNLQAHVHEHGILSHPSSSVPVSQGVAHHQLIMGTLSPSSPDRASPDVVRSGLHGGHHGAPEFIGHPPPSMSPPKPIRTSSPTLLPEATAAVEISQPDSPCLSKGTTTATGVVRGRITIPCAHLLSCSSVTAACTVARLRACPCQLMNDMGMAIRTCKQ